MKLRSALTRVNDSFSTPHTGRVDARIAGTCMLPKGAFRRRIGARTYALWERLCATRNDFTGQSEYPLTYVTDDLVREAQREGRTLSRRAVHDQHKRAMARLRACGLVTTGHWKQAHRGPARSMHAGRSARFAYSYVVHGLPDVPARHDVVMVPHAVEAWMGTTSRRGGARPGAGRPRKNKDTVELNTPVDDSFEFSEFKTAPEEFKTAPPGLVSTPVGVDPFPSEKDIVLRARQGSAFFLGEEATAVRVHTQPKPAASSPRASGAALAPRGPAPRPVGRPASVTPPVPTAPRAARPPRPVSPPAPVVQEAVVVPATRPVAAPAGVQASPDASATPRRVHEASSGLRAGVVGACATKQPGAVASPGDAVAEACAYVATRPDLVARGVPPRVRVDSLTPRTPRPQHLDPHKSVEENARFLALQIAEELEFTFPKTRQWALRKLNARTLHALSACVGVLMEYELPPIYWIRFSLWQYREGDTFAAMRKRHGDGPPPLAWLLSPTRVTKYHGWARSEGDARWVGGKALATEQMRELTKRQHAMRMALLAAQVTMREMSAPQAALLRAAIVHVTLPWPTYSRLVHEVETQCTSMKDEIAARVNGGRRWYR